MSGSRGGVVLPRVCLRAEVFVQMFPAAGADILGSLKHDKLN